MAPVAKSSSEQGQISIFFSASLVVLISIIAFVINVGLFVKAKINLQNATDAAAFSGAAVQSRQLSKIAYLNWEMRNIYKEWLYKYYVIGNLNVADVETPSDTGAMSFRLRTDTNVVSSRQTNDFYNIPAVCLHLTGSQTNICKRYSVPGFPEFGSSELPGAEEASRNFLNNLISSKINDCVDRTRYNMLSTVTWAYNVLSDPSLDNTMAGQGPAILTDRQGAWPRAVELALRMRNLEKIMNREPETSGVCLSGSSSVGNCSKSIDSIIGESKVGNERIVKAFYSAYRNLGNSSDSEMKDSFILTELAPTVPDIGGPANASNLLIPSNAISTYKKYYVDLKLMLVNYATFYAAFIPRATSNGSEQTSGACDISKVAIPVPGYPLGFYKNPDVITYYAVRGEAEFVGMFNPFAEQIKMTAFSAAKPMGGRIGPILFIQKPGSDFFVGRTDNQKFRSIPYIASLDFVGTPKRFGGNLALGEFEPGVPIPINNNNDPGYFWLKDEGQPLGGIIADASGIQFGIPNLVYDYDVPFQTDGYIEGNQRINIIKTNAPLDQGAVPVLRSSQDKKTGLYSKSQFSKFRGTNLTNNISVNTLKDEIARVRAPTLYEAANYLIPSPHDFNLSQNLDSFGFISGAKRSLTNGIEVTDSLIYAPLLPQQGEADLLFTNSAQVLSTIYEYMRAQETGMKKYKMSMNKAAITVFNSAPPGIAAGSIEGYQRSARGISDITDLSPGANLDQNPNSCKSIAGQFLHFFYGHPSLPNLVGNRADCPTSLPEQLERYFSLSGANQPFNGSFYQMEFSWPTSLSNANGLKMLTAYAPGPVTGVGNDAKFVNPIPGSNTEELMKRNFYSTKLIPLESVRNGQGYNETTNQFSIYSEGDTSTGGDDRRQGNFKNYLDAAASSADLSNIRY